MIMVRGYNCLRSRSNRTIDQRSNFVAIWHVIVRKEIKNALFLSMISVLLLFLASCVPQSSQSAAKEKLNDEEHARQALMDFLGNMHTGNYAEAAQYYGGSYETMTDHNPEIDPNDHPALLRNACTINGMQCLQAKVVGLEDKVPGEKYVFIVEFLEEDGTLFMLESCCGSEERSFPAQSVFHFLVREVDQNKFAVMDMPPYAP